MPSSSIKSVSGLLLNEGNGLVKSKEVKKFDSKNFILLSNVVIWITVIVMGFILINLMRESHGNSIKPHGNHSMCNESSSENRESFRNMEERLTSLGEEMQDTLVFVKSNLIPTGFIYVQLPHQDPPSSLWPWAKWREVTSIYSGYFFRAEGGDSAPFGVPQEDAIRQHQHRSIDISGFTEKRLIHSLKDGPDNYIDYVSKTGNITSINRKYVSDRETRPKNYAVKIWMKLA